MCKIYAKIMFSVQNVIMLHFRSVVTYFVLNKYTKGLSTKKRKKRGGWGRGWGLNLYPEIFLK